jgi:NAD(P)H-dependent FMN reductase
MELLNIAIILGSTRPNRVGGIVANWVYDTAKKHGDASFELLDLAEVALPLFDEGLPPAAGVYTKQHTRDWAAKIASFDGFIFVTPEYNHSIPAALKNALDFVYAEWNNKAAGIVSYGAASGIRAAEQLRLILGELQIATVRAQVTLDSYRDFEDFYDFKPTEQHVEALRAMSDQVVSWGTALKSTRSYGTMTPQT